ncbi:hypothetical protein ABZS29_36240 [Kribbella sp. NPDC005582]|uniref:hypothetical protein n=1 Tax=Kribbella sp. NPDC005582 TaxID=3156893 RepID=UPI0033BEF0CA
MSTQAVTAVISDPALFTEWMIAVPAKVRVPPNWPAAGSVVERDDGRDARGRHTYIPQLVVAISDSWRGDEELGLRQRSSLGGWVRLTIKLQPRPGGCLVEVWARAASASALLRYVGPGRAQVESRCATVAQRLIDLAAAVESADDPGMPRD